MKKISYLFAAIFSLIGISSVNADTYQVNINVNHFDYSINYYLEHTDVFNNLISLWESNYSSSFPYYFITVVPDSDIVYLIYDDSNSSYWTLRNGWPALDSYSHKSYSPNNTSSYENVIVYDNGSIFYSYPLSYGDQYLFYGGLIDYDKRFPLINHGFLFTNNPTSYIHNNDTVPIDYDKILFNSFSSSSLDFSFSSFEVNEGDLLPSYLDLYNNTYQNNIFANYTEINLNNYAYIALSLKDYSLRNDEINQFSTNIYTKGQLCLTPVYNYGMTEKSSVYGSSYQVQGCSVYYDDFTPVRTYILKQDLENHAIYYVKAYDTSKNNIIKVDSSVFDISYISSEDSSSPTVSVNGRSYPTIAYDDLNSSSTVSEENNYNSGVVCNIGDLNCVSEVSDMSWSDIFSSPLKALQSVWSAIVSILAVITAFIALLPSTMQGFLYASFGLAILLGIIKILL